MLSSMALFLALGSAATTQHLHEPLTQVQACKQFDSAIVGVEAHYSPTEVSSGTGFIVSSDGLILTAAHIIFDKETGRSAQTIKIMMPDHSILEAMQVLPISETKSHDFALLKVDKSGLPSLRLGDESNVPVGSPITIIGFPLSTGIVMKFCFTGTIVAKPSFTEGGTQFNIIYFQGISIKGISGAPIISLDSGTVIGIENASLAGIGPALEKTKKETEALAAKGSSVAIMGVNFVPTIYNIVDVLDRQLANGLGAGNGISAARLAIEKAKEENKK